MFNITICSTSVGTTKRFLQKKVALAQYFLSKVIKEYNKFMGRIDFLDQKLNKDKKFSLLKTICRLFGS